MDSNREIGIASGLRGPQHMQALVIVSHLPQSTRIPAFVVIESRNWTGLPCHHQTLEVSLKLIYPSSFREWHSLPLSSNMSWLCIDLVTVNTMVWKCLGDPVRQSS